MISINLDRSLCKGLTAIHLPIEELDLWSDSFVPASDEAIALVDALRRIDWKNLLKLGSVSFHDDNIGAAYTCPTNKPTGSASYDDS